MKDFPCRRCNETISGRYHSEILPRFKLLWEEHQTAQREAEFGKAEYLFREVQVMLDYIAKNYPDHMGRTAMTVGMVAEFEPISNLEYLEIKSCQKEVSDEQQSDHSIHGANRKASRRAWTDISDAGIDAFNNY